MSGEPRQEVKLDAGKPAPDEPNPSLTRHERQWQQALTQIEEALHGLRFGQVTITVQDGVVVQIDRLERKRLQRNSD
jgi:hypothetical protein